MKEVAMSIAVKEGRLPPAFLGDRLRWNEGREVPALLDLPRMKLALLSDADTGGLVAGPHAPDAPGLPGGVSRFSLRSKECNDPRDKPGGIVGQTRLGRSRRRNFARVGYRLTGRLPDLTAPAAPFRSPKRPKRGGSWDFEYFGGKA